MFMTVKQASEKWGISDRRIRVLCSEGKIPEHIKKDEGGKFLLMQLSLQMVVTNQKKVSCYKLTVKKRNWMAEGL